jgi:hypothetical protein
MVCLLFGSQDINVRGLLVFHNLLVYLQYTHVGITGGMFQQRKNKDSGGGTPCVKCNSTCEITSQVNFASRGSNSRSRWGWFDMSEKDLLGILLWE